MEEGGVEFEEEVGYGGEVAGAGGFFELAADFDDALGAKVQAHALQCVSVKR